MSESNTSSESSGFNSGGNNNRGLYGKSTESPSEYTYKSKIKVIEEEKDKQQKEKEETILGIKEYLKSLELFVLDGLKNEGSVYNKTFIESFRKIIIDNENKIKKIPNASFFIEEYKLLESSEAIITIIDLLEVKKQNENAQNSKLKYW